LVDKHTKEAAVEDGPEIHDKIPRELFITRVKGNGLKMWQAIAMDKYGEGSGNWSFFFVSE
jgi:hypothetical protein